MGGGASGLHAAVAQRYEALGVSPQDTVFSKQKYAAGWAGLASADEFDSVIIHGLACKRGFEDLACSFRDWWMAKRRVRRHSLRETRERDSRRRPPWPK